MPAVTYQRTKTHGKLIRQQYCLMEEKTHITDVLIVVIAKGCCSFFFFFKDLAPMHKGSSAGGGSKTKLFNLIKR